MRNTEIPQTQGRPKSTQNFNILSPEISKTETENFEHFFKQAQIEKSTESEHDHYLRHANMIHTCGKQRLKIVAAKHISKNSAIWETLANFE